MDQEKIRTVYKKNFLSDVILRTDFSSLISLTSEILRKLRDDLKIEGLEFKEQEVKQIELKTEKEGQSFSFKTIGKSGMYIFNKNLSRFEFDHESFTLVSNTYERFSKFFESFKDGFLKMRNLMDIKEFKRIGLRYINKIELPDAEPAENWKDYIISEVVPNYENVHKITPPNFSLRRNLNVFWFGDGEFYAKIHTGRWNKNFPSVITDRELILDIDCYIDNVVLGVEDILEKPIKMNEVAFNFFNLFTSDKFKTMLEEK